MVHGSRDRGWALVALYFGLCACCGAAPGRGPGSATVAVVHSDALALPKSLLAPLSVYPLGKLDSRVVAVMMDRAAMLATGTTRIDDAWRSLAGPSDRVGILLDAQDPPASLDIVDVLIDRLVRVGVRAANVVIWAQDERVLFSAGLLVGSNPDGVGTLGADSEGYRGGLSRIVVDECDVLINLARLRVKPRLGLWGALANLLACVPEDERIRLMANPAELASVAARPSAKRKFVLHLLDAMQPNYAPGPVSIPPYWQCGAILASRDAVALDCSGQQLLEDERGQVKGAPWPLEPAPSYLKAACETYNVGQCDPAKVTVLKSEVGAP